jgi:hypothetical protein
MAQTTRQVDDIIRKYRQAADNTRIQDPKVANRWARVLHKLYKKLSVTDEGKESILTLLSDPSPHVRCWAATHALEWAVPIARSVLEELRDSNGPCSFDATIVLRELDKGRLTIW